MIRTSSIAVGSGWVIMLSSDAKYRILQVTTVAAIRVVTLFICFGDNKRSLYVVRGQYRLEQWYVCISPTT